MSMGPIGGIASSVAGTSLAQAKGSEVERAQHDSTAQQNRAQNDMRAEMAAGIGQADGEDHEAAERDADGRRLWEQQAGPPKAEDETPPPPPPMSKDATGQSGNNLDLSG